MKINKQNLECSMKAMDKFISRMSKGREQQLQKASQQELRTYDPNKDKSLERKSPARAADCRSQPRSNSRAPSTDSTNLKVIKEIKSIKCFRTNISRKLSPIGSNKTTEQQTSILADNEPN